MRPYCDVGGLVAAGFGVSISSSIESSSESASFDCAAAAFATSNENHQNANNDLLSFFHRLKYVVDLKRQEDCRRRAESRAHHRANAFASMPLCLRINQYVTLNK